MDERHILEERSFVLERMFDSRTDDEEFEGFQPEDPAALECHRVRQSDHTPTSTPTTGQGPRSLEASVDDGAAIAMQAPVGSTGTGPEPAAYPDRKAVRVGLSRSTIQPSIAVERAVAGQWQDHFSHFVETSSAVQALSTTQAQPMPRRQGHSAPSRLGQRELIGLPVQQPTMWTAGQSPNMEQLNRIFPSPTEIAELRATLLTMQHQMQQLQQRLLHFSMQHVPVSSDQMPRTSTGDPAGNRSKCGGTPRYQSGYGNR